MSSAHNLAVNDFLPFLTHPLVARGFQEGAPHVGVPCQVLVRGGTTAGGRPRRERSSCHLTSGDSRERAEDASIWGRKAEGEALRNIIYKLSDERNLRDLHLKHYHMSTAQFKKRTTHLDIPGHFYDLYQHVAKTCPFCNSIKPTPERSRVSGLRAEEFGDLIFLDHGSAKIGDKTFGFLIVWMEPHHM